MQNKIPAIPLFSLRPHDPISAAALPPPKPPSPVLTGIDYVDPAKDKVAPAEPSNEELLKALRAAEEKKKADGLLEKQYNAIAQKAAITLEQRDALLIKVKAAKNPLLEASKPLIYMLADIRKTNFTTSLEIESFRRLLDKEVITHKILCDRADVLREHTATASYCLCVALDEAASSTGWGGSQGELDPGVWAGGKLLSATHHNDVEGGEKFFKILGKIANEPEEHHDLIEVQYYILNMGFEGKHYADHDGKDKLRILRERVNTLIYSASPTVPKNLSPNLQLSTPGKFMPWRSVPVGLVVALAVLIAVGIFSWYKYQLTTESEQLIRHINDIGQMTPPPTQAVPLHLKQLLKDEIAHGKVLVDERNPERQTKNLR